MRYILVLTNTTFAPLLSILRSYTCYSSICFPEALIASPCCCARSTAESFSVKTHTRNLTQPDFATTSLLGTRNNSRLANPYRATRSTFPRLVSFSSQWPTEYYCDNRPSGHKSPLQQHPNNSGTRIITTRTSPLDEDIF